MVHFVKTDFQPNFGKSIFGVTWEGTLVNRTENAKYYVPQEIYKPRIYPTYCSGATYLISFEATRAIVEKAAEFPFLHIEDVFYTGILADAAGIPRVDKTGIFWWWDYTINYATCDAGGVLRIATMNEFNTPSLFVKRIPR
ncbi:hypothetical protein L596_014185 [Steinernema carpocapsae]|uniref:Hexosyltransferase n=1 Tax=Steinernema carpocapsae TaxID=34508 RepID=A0A4U5NCB3_STECR|nr:hypothetical protein L596_014185 [Steinernema carpocapsae]